MGETPADSQHKGKDRRGEGGQKDPSQEDSSECGFEDASPQLLGCGPSGWALSTPLVIFVTVAPAVDGLTPAAFLLPEALLPVTHRPGEPSPLASSNRLTEGRGRAASPQTPAASRR